MQFREYIDNTDEWTQAGCHEHHQVHPDEAQRRMLEGVWGEQLAMGKRVLFPSGLGFVFGVLMALPLAFPVELSNTAFETINAPAFWLAHAWTEAGLPPRGEVAWVAVPMAAILVQWTLLGLLIGLSCCFKFRRTRPSALCDNQVPASHETRK